MEDLKTFERDYKRNNILNFVFRGVSILLSLFLVNVNLSYLGTTLYGLYITITSIAGWASIMDLGISGGLRNELTQAVANNDVKKQKDLIYTAVVMLARLSFLVFIVLSVVSEILFFTSVIEESLRLPMYVTNLFFCISFVTGISRTVALSYQRSWYSSVAVTITQIAVIFTVLILLWLDVEPNLVYFSFLIGLMNNSGNVVIIVSLYNKLKKDFFRVAPKKYDKEQQNAIVNVGVQFFVLQVCCLILYATDNVIINKLFSSEMVTKYSVINSIYVTGESLFAIFFVSLWSAVTYTATKDNYDWILKERDKLFNFWIIFSFGTIFVSLILNFIVKIWLGKSAFYYEPELIGIFAIYTIITQYGAIYVNITNGLGRIKLQMICSVIGAVLNIPLSIWFAYYLGWGLVGIKAATLCCLVGSFIIVPIDIIRLLNSKKN